MGSLYIALSSMEKTIFQKIIDRDIQANIEYEDDRCIVIHDIAPQAPIHLLIIPKKHIARLAQANTEEDFEALAYLLKIVVKISHKLSLGDGFRVVVNNGSSAGETVPHLHLHILSGRTMNWPPG